MNWAEDQAKRIGDAERTISAKREWQLHVSEVIQSDGPALFRSFVDSIQKNVGEFNTAIGKDFVEVKKGEQQVHLCAKSTIESTLKLSFEQSRVIADAAERNRGRAVSSAKWNLPFQVDDQGVLSIAGNSDLDSLAQTLIQRVADGAVGLRRG